MTFQEKLYQLRRERSLSQEGLASALGVSRQAVQKWESGAASPDTNNLIALSDFFGVTLDSLLKNDTAALAPALGDGAPEERVWRPYHYEYKSRRTYLACLWCISISGVGAFAGPRGLSP